MGEQPHIAAEDYLKHIYALSLVEVPVRTSRLAEAMGVSPASVTEMVKRLGERGLVTYRPYRGVELTEDGRRGALAVVRRHRLWELFLHRELGIAWGDVHDYACRLEHATDERLAEALDRHLGRPDFDPHGDPIPSADGAVVEVERLPLTALLPGEAAVITQCADEDPKLLAYLADLGLVPGAGVRLVARAPFNGPLTVAVEGGPDRAVGPEVAATLFVKRRAEVDQRG